MTSYELIETIPKSWGSDLHKGKNINDEGEVLVGSQTKAEEAQFVSHLRFAMIAAIQHLKRGVYRRLLGKLQSEVAIKK